MIDEYGEGVYPDLKFYYGIDLVDVIQGRGPAPSLVWSCVQRLPDDSLTAALMRGGREHFGWGEQRHLMADQFLALTAMSGKAMDHPARPVIKQPKHRRSVREIYEGLGK